MSPPHHNPRTASDQPPIPTNVRDKQDRIQDLVQPFMIHVLVQPHRLHKKRNGNENSFFEALDELFLLPKRACAIP